MAWDAILNEVVPMGGMGCHPERGGATGCGTATSPRVENLEEPAEDADGDLSNCLFKWSESKELVLA